MTQDVERPLTEAQQGHRHLERLVMLSDGVFAIAITLSAIEIKPETGGEGSLWQAWSLPLLVYFLSFFLIGLIWLVHRRIMAWLSHIDGPGTLINMVLLSLVALVPVVVRFALTYPQREGAFLVYALGFSVLYLGLAVLWGYLAFVARLAVHASRSAALQLLAKLCFAVAVFLGVAMFQLGWMVGAVLCVLLALPLRWLAWRHGREAATGS
ncbi:TMEM175 family protein [Dyella sp. C9]|uniref:TMEM175 family protein n=1 Tax=Dyella sp. C9 TaxID=2202154 RepID=UPI0018E4DC55|nr:TMEM175 family protein [Dyella sp. C9]